MHRKRCLTINLATTFPMKTVLAQAPSPCTGIPQCLQVVELIPSGTPAGPRDPFAHRRVLYSAPSLPQPIRPPAISISCCACGPVMSTCKRRPDVCCSMRSEYVSTADDAANRVSGLQRGHRLQRHQLPLHLAVPLPRFLRIHGPRVSRVQSGRLPSGL